MPSGKDADESPSRPRAGSVNLCGNSSSGGFASSVPIDPALAEIVEEFTRRVQNGEAVDPAAYGTDHPEWATLLRILLLTLGDLAQLSRSPMTRPLSKGALGSLPSKDREVLVMRHIEQFSTVEIASRLGITEGAVKARLLRALLRLRGRMKSET